MNTTTLDLPETAVVVRESQAVGPALSVNQLTERLEFIRQVMAKAMNEGQDYGKVPGCGDKPGLFQPGAQKLSMTFQLNPEVKEETITDYQNYHRGYRIVVRVSNGSKFADGVGECSTLESKYRFRSATKKCPKCGKESIIKGKAEYGGGWLCFAKKGGCGAKFTDGDTSIESQVDGKVENENPADAWNTARKMAFKRAFVHAIINATNTSELWSQDLEDLENGHSEPPKPPAQEVEPKARQEAKPPINVAHRPTVAPKKAAVASSEQDKADHAVLLKAAYKLIPESMRADVARYLTDFKGEDGRSFHWLLPTESLEDLSVDRLRQLVNNWSDGFAPRIDHWILQNDQVPGAEAPPAEAGPDFTLKSDDSPWRRTVIHFGQHKGKRLDELEKNTMWGFWANWKPVASEKHGISLQDAELRNALDAAGKHYEFNPPKA